MLWRRDDGRGPQPIGRAPAMPPTPPQPAAPAEPPGWRELCEQLRTHDARIESLAGLFRDVVIRNHRVSRRESVTISPAPTVIHPDDFRFVQIYCASGASLIITWRTITYTLTTVNGWNALNVGDGAELTVAVNGNFNAILQYSDDKLP